MTSFREYLKTHPHVGDELFLLILAVVIFLTKMNILGLPYHWDDGVYINPSHWLVSTNFIHVLPGLHPPELFYGHPFGLPLILAVLFRIFGENPSVAHIFILALTTMGVWHTYLLGKLLHCRIAGIMAAFLLFFSPIYFAQSGMVNADIAITALGVMTIYYALTERYISYFIVASLLLMTKESSIAIVISLLVFLYFKEGMSQGWKQIKKYSLPLFFFVVFFISQKIFTGSFLPNPYFKSNNFMEYDYSIIINKANYVVNTIFRSQYRFILALVIVLNILLNKRKAIKNEYIIFISAVLSFITAFTFIFFLPRYILPLLPYFCIMASAAILMLFNNKGAALITTLIIIILFFTRFNGTGNGPGSFETDMQYVDVVTTHVSGCDYIEKYYPDKRVLTCWPFNRELNEPHLGYVKNRIKTIYYTEKISDDDYDIIVYSQQSNPTHIQILELIERKKMILSARFEKNGKSVHIYVKPIIDKRILSASEKRNVSTTLRHTRSEFIM